MGNVRIELNRAGVRELLLSNEILAVCEKVADGVAMRAGEGYGVNVFHGRNRVNAEVQAETAAAYRDNLKNNTLLKALG